jgi:hypothetical protein
MDSSIRHEGLLPTMRGCDRRCCLWPCLATRGNSRALEELGIFEGWQGKRYFPSKRNVLKMNA